MKCLKFVDNNFMNLRIFIRSWTSIKCYEHLLSWYLSLSHILIIHYICNLFILNNLLSEIKLWLLLVSSYILESSNSSKSFEHPVSYYLSLSFSCTSSHLFYCLKSKLRNEHFMWLRNGIVALVHPPPRPLSHGLNGQSGNTSLKVGTSAPAWSNTIFMTPHKTTKTKPLTKSQPKQAQVRSQFALPCPASPTPNKFG